MARKRREREREGGRTVAALEREGGERINEGVKERQGAKNAGPAVLNT